MTGNRSICVEGAAAIQRRRRSWAAASSCRGISRAFSQAAANQLNTSQSSLGQLTALQSYTTQIDNLFGTTVGGLEHRAAELLQRIFRRRQRLRPRPPSRQALLGKAQSVAQTASRTPAPSSTT